MVDTSRRTRERARAVWWCAARAETDGAKVERVYSPVRAVSDRVLVPRARSLVIFLLAKTEEGTRGRASRRSRGSSFADEGGASKGARDRRHGRQREGPRWLHLSFAAWARTRHRRGKELCCPNSSGTRGKVRL